MNQPRQPKVIAYRVRKSLTSFNPHLGREEVIPVGSTIEWRVGDYSGGLAGVYWLRQRVLVKDSELFTNCEPAAEGPSKYTGSPGTP